MKIQDIPTERFDRVLQSFRRNKWRTIYSYKGFDAGIDYDEIHLSKDGKIVKFVWDNWTEGEISSEDEIAELRALL